MNTKWEESFDEEFGSSLYAYEHLNTGGNTARAINKNKELKAFIKDQITEAEKRGFEQGVNKMASFIGAEEHSKASSDMPECKCGEIHFGQLSEKPKTMTEVMIQEREDEFYRIAKKQAQQEIAEQILQDIPKKWNISFMQRVDLSDLKDQLRKKYL